MIWWYGHGWLSWFGQRVPAIADESRCSPKTVRRWLHRFNRLGLDGRKTWVARAAGDGSARRNAPGSPAWSKSLHRAG
ncbi:helix-turn-helix domain-containing protein [Streptomyces sp. NPDC018045]|uniref:helix-turn-helix domain-containing protein n=1 Tax=Streptomyces sp. NPDC018045 TaxID=3365037 RepID=UPI0037BD1DB5